MLYKKRYLPNYWDSKLHVELTDEFRAELFSRAIKRAGGKHADLADRLQFCRQVVGEWFTGGRWPTLHITYKIAEIAGSTKKQVNQNLKNITALQHSGAVCAKQFLEFDPCMAEWFGLLKGDGCISQKYVNCGNTEYSIVLFFADVLSNRFYIPKEKISFTLRMPKKHLQDQKIIDKTVKLLEGAGFSANHVRVEKCPRGKKPLIVARVNSKAFAIILRNFVRKIKNVMLISPANVKADYLKGLYGAEGSVSGRRVTLSMKDFKELQFAKELLNDLGLRESVVIRKQQGGMWALEIYGRKNIEKFQNVVGFGHHSIRNSKLKHLLNLYLHYYFSPNERSEQVRKIIQGSGTEVTASYVAKKLGISCHHACYLLSSLTNKGELKVNKLMRPYIYTINSEANAKNYPT